MSPRARLDRELVRRGLARSREEAVELINAGRVRVGGSARTGLPVKPATAVTPDTPLSVLAVPGPRWASRAGFKLDGALTSFAARAAAVPVAGRVCLDAGASTGGFTDVLLTRGAVRVHAVDVGQAQLVWRLAGDERVRVHDGVNVRWLTPQLLGEQAALTVADLSFISLCTVLPALQRCTCPGGDVVVLVKPQFEVGRERVGRGGVVHDPQARTGAVLAVASCAARLGLQLRDLVASSLPGAAGNQEYLLWFTRTDGAGELGTGERGEGLSALLLAAGLPPPP